GRKIYLTVNTLLKEEELAELYDYICPFYEAGLDAVIVQDLGVLGFIRKHFPALELHASTQMTLCSHYGAELLKELGVSRIVSARELSLRELSEIKSLVDIELETFIHGAMCYCYSGQCLFSSVLGGRSGNRGRCAQPCRLPYTVRTDKRQSGTCYPLSLKDMCTIGHIPRLIEAGIDSLKIEGRMKKPEYTAGVTALYRKYIDRYYELREQYGRDQAAKKYKVSQEDLDALSALYIRSGKQDGYYFKHNGREMVTLSNPAYGGNDEMLLAEIRTRYLEEHLKRPVKMKASFVTGMPAEVTLQADGLSVTVRGMAVERAQKQPITEENVRTQLGKMGD
ncbi:MAG: U32 family peptidase, partial [Acetatifactor sp.]|nr:U32 family peptidase [Acetatifactor sp.]